MGGELRERVNEGGQGREHNMEEGRVRIRWKGSRECQSLSLGLYRLCLDALDTVTASSLVFRVICISSLCCRNFNYSYQSTL